MGIISVSLPSDGTTADVADYNTPITTITNTINGNLDNSNLAPNAAIDGAKTADFTIGTNKLSSTTITLGYAQAVASQTIATTTATALTSLTATVNLPGTRNIEVTVDIPYATSGAAPNFVTLELLNGATVIRATRIQVPLNGSTGVIRLTRILQAPAAGSQTYSARITQDSASGVDYIAGATTPSFLIVKAI